MTFVKKFKEGDHVMTNYIYERDVRGSTKSGFVVNEYMSEQASMKKGIMTLEKSGKFLHLVQFKDTNGFKHTLNAVYLEKTN